MVGPLSFVDHSRWPNSFHTIIQEVMSLRSLRTRTEGEKITEVWAGVFWQLQRRMFVSTYRTPFKSFGVCWRCSDIIRSQNCPEALVERGAQ